MSPTAPAPPRPADVDGVVYPTKRDEAWRHAPHRELAELTFGSSVGLPAEIPAELEQRIPALGGPIVVVVNGVVDHERSSFDAPAGVAVSSLAVAVESNPDLIERRGGVVADAYTAINLTYGTDGAFISVADGVVLDAPIHVVDLTVPGGTTNASCTGVVIDVGVGSSVTVVETRLGAGTEFGGSNVLTTIDVGDDAVLEHVVLQDLPAQQVHLGRVEVRQGARSTVRIRSFNLGASYGRLAYHVELAGAAAVTDLSGLYFGVGEQILDQQITVIHRATDCTSRQSFRGVLDDASTGVFNGGIDVCPGADGTDAEQSNDNLLLSNRAEVNTQPRLEILADEVACKHGATVGQLDDTALYYLRSRGIGVDEARRLLINGFADQMVDAVGSEPVRSWVTQRLGHDHD